MIEDFRIELIQMMENAGRSLAHLARVLFLGGEPVGKRIAVLAGSGGNGGGAMVCARRLCGWGAEVRVAMTRTPEELTDVVAHQQAILQKARL